MRKFGEGATVRRLFTALVAAFAALPFQGAFAATPNYDGPRLTSIAYVESAPGVVFAAGDGVYKSVDGGRTWQSVSAEFGLGMVLVDPHEARRIIAYDREHNPNHRGRYFESTDQGRTWQRRSARTAELPFAERRLAPNMDAFVMHPDRPGHWLASFDGGLRATRDAGKTWKEIAGTFGTPIAGGDGFYALSAGLLWRSPEGVTWNAVELPSATKAVSLAKFGHWPVVVRTRDGWLALSGDSFHAVELALPDERRGTSRAICHPWVEASAHSAVDCTDRSLSGASPFFDHDAQFMSFDEGKTWKQVASQGLPRSFRPTAFARHPSGDGRMLAGWINGHVFRSDDFGATWSRSDDGLVFPARFRHQPEFGLPFLLENALNRAVMLNDRVAIQSVLAAGADINAKGPTGRSATGWAIVMSGRERYEPALDYWHLRSLGARPPAPSEPESPKLLEKVISWLWVDVMEDLLVAGWPLSLEVADPSRQKSLLSLVLPCGTTELKCEHSLMGKPVSHWVGIYLRTARPGRGAPVVADLAALGEMSLAMKVAQFDAGRYSAADKAWLLETLPSGARALRASVLRERAPRR